MRPPVFCPTAPSLCGIPESTTRTARVSSGGRTVCPHQQAQMGSAYVTPQSTSAFLLTLRATEVDRFETKSTLEKGAKSIFATMDTPSGVANYRLDRAASRVIRRANTHGNKQARFGGEYEVSFQVRGRSMRLNTHTRGLGFTGGSGQVLSPFSYFRTTPRGSACGAYVNSGSVISCHE